MHVLVIGHTRFPIRQPFPGGLEAMTWHLARGLVARGHRVTVFAAEGSDQLVGADYLVPDRLELSPAARSDVSMPDPGWLDRHHAYLHLMMGLTGRDDVDVVHNHALHYLPVAMSPVLPMPFLTTLHTPPTPWLESAVTASHAATGGRRPHFAAVSRWTAQAWKPLVRARVVPNGVDTGVWRAGPGGERLVWAGRIVPEKAPHLAVQIARRAGMPLVLAGPVSDGDYARDVLWPLLGSGVEYAGHLSDPELAHLVGTSAAALVTPAWDEPYGLVAAEALACGTPVLAFDRGGLSEVVRPEVGVLVAPGPDVVERSAAALPDVLSRPRERARAVAVEHHSVERMVEGYLQLYARLLTDPGADPAGPPRHRPVRRPRPGSAVQVPV
ncbi:glycosyltransferase [Ornithinimicrobium sp. LYQ121]|uniref:glycosyltransferase n=1 Tax=Ornithinimicrobium sp. LYQ121 TaxID=3378801 RepID=UPI0038521175